MSFIGIIVSFISITVSFICIIVSFISIIVYFIGIIVSFISITGVLHTFNCRVLLFGLFNWFYSVSLRLCSQVLKYEFHSIAFLTYWNDKESILNQNSSFASYIRAILGCRVHPKAVYSL